MSVQVSVLIDQKVLIFTTGISYFEKLYMHKHIIAPLDPICDISITKDLFIITTEDPDFRDGGKEVPWIKQDRSINNINAYDWNGKHLWNIADIVGDIKMSLMGGQVCTKEAMESYPGFDATIAEDGHELFSCTTGYHLYIIDLTDRKFLQKLETR